ncbi:MAG: sulfite exporter TauE/SafE family protein [Acidimicrobiia bacterium]
MTHHAHAAAGNLDLVGFLLLGLLGSAAHCAVMCGPFALLVSDRYAAPRTGRPVWAAQLWYAAGRTATYAVRGAVAGVAGAWLQVADGIGGLGRAAAVVAGSALVMSAVLHLSNAGLAFPGDIARFTRVLYRTLPAHPLTLGLVLGFLPCGLLYTAVVAAVARGTVGGGALALAVFAAGTMPSLLGVAVAQRRLRRHAAALVPASHVFVLAMGLWYLWRGLGA